MVHFDILVSKYGATHFRTALERIIALTNEPNLTRAQLERRLWGVRIPFNKLPVWHRIKFMQTDPSMSMVLTADSIHCCPKRHDSHGKLIPGHFDTALINDGTGEDIGLDGSVATAQLGSAPARLGIWSHIYSSLLISRAYKYDSKRLVSGSERLKQLFLLPKKEISLLHKFYAQGELI